MTDNLTLLLITRIKVKEQRFYCCSA